MTPLHHIGEFLRQLFLQVPLGAVRALFVGVFVALLLWALTLPREQTAPPGASPKPGANLKLWAALAIGIQAVIYALM